MRRGYRSSRFGARIALYSAVAFLFAACVGLDADIVVQADGSGTVSLTYRVSRLVESMGKVEGASRFLPLPVDRASFERLLAESGSLTLDSFSVEGNEAELLVSAVISFADPSALARLWNAAGRAATFSIVESKRTLAVTLSEGGGPLDPDLKRLVDGAFKGYLIRVAYRLPTTPTVVGGTADAAARTALFSAPTGEVLSSEAPRTWSVTW